jgi:D-alanyl-D-alanine dipeptidase
MSGMRCSQRRPVARMRPASTFNMLICAGLALIMMMLPAPALAGSALPKGFVYLRDIDPTIVQDIRYAGSHNFVGRPIRGYLAAECILSEPAANALADVQSRLAEKKLSLIVWDCYRPKRAVDDFLQWSKDPARSEMKTEFYPRNDKEDLFALGYLAKPSAHSRGSTVDLAIAVPQAMHVSKKREIRGWNDRFRDRLRLSGRAGKPIKHSCGRHSITQPSNTKILHEWSRLSSLCQGMVALRTYQ